MKLKVGATYLDGNGKIIEIKGTEEAVGRPEIFVGNNGERYTREGLRLTSRAVDGSVRLVDTPQYAGSPGHLVGTHSTKTKRGPAYGSKGRRARARNKLSKSKPKRRKDDHAGEAD